MTDAVLAIDPGPATSGWVLFDGASVVDGAPDTPNADIASDVLTDRLRDHITSGRIESARCAVEWLSSYGMPVGADVFETAYWVGRFVQRVKASSDIRILRRDVKLHLCHSARAKDANVRTALIDRFGGVGGKAVAVGTKAAPGPLYGTRSHMWAALAVAVTWWDTRRALAQRGS